MNILNLPQDRDYTPYAYPAIFKTGYLEAGHVDIKPPLIHWSYKLWMPIASIFKSASLAAKLRMLPYLGMILSCVLMDISGHTQAALILALFCASASLWPHMANTEWLTVLLMTITLTLPQPWGWLILGLLPWANQKNALLIPILVWALRLDLSWASLLVFAPSLAILSYLFATKRLAKFVHWCWFVPATFGAKRTFKANVLGMARLTVPALAVLAPFIATMDADRWSVVLLVMIALLLWSRQIVPHHFIMLTFPIAMSAHITPMSMFAFALVWCHRDFMCLIDPSVVYKFTFSMAGSDYGSLLKDASKIEAWIRANTNPDDVIWVNGMENQIYLNTNRKAWRIEIPELTGMPEGTPPRYIVHCSYGHKKYDYDGYEPVSISTGGALTLMVKHG